MNIFSLKTRKNNIWKKKQNYKELFESLKNRTKIIESAKKDRSDILCACVCVWLLNMNFVNNG